MKHAFASGWKPATRHGAASVPTASRQAPPRGELASATSLRAGRPWALASHFRVRSPQFRVRFSAVSGSGSPQFRVRFSAVSGPGPSAVSGPVLRSFGSVLRSFGSVLRSFGSVLRSFGSVLRSFGSGSPQFRVRFFCWNFSQVSDNKLFVKPRRSPNLLNSVFNKNNTNNKRGGAFLKV